MEINLPVSQSFFMATPFNVSQFNQPFFMANPVPTFYGNPVQCFPYNVFPVQSTLFGNPWQMISLIWQPLILSKFMEKFHTPPLPLRRQHLAR